MKSVLKLIRRCVGILLLSSLLLLVLNVVLLFLFTAAQTPNAYPWKTAEEVAGALSKGEDGRYILPSPLAQELKDSGAWGIYIENQTGQVKWQTEELPETIPRFYAIADIPGLTRGYLDGYPTFTGAAKEGLVVLGYPRDSFWKHMWPSWDYHTISNLPRAILQVLAINAALIFLIYIIANSKLLRSVKPIINGIRDLPEGEPVYIKEKGLLWELAESINKTSEILQTQKYQLRRKETARANWIVGVSHDIRTPLSMVMGYAGQLREDSQLTVEGRKKAEVIVRQSQRMRNLINDLNLASKLEYNMQPLHLREENMIAIVRQVAVDFINMDIEEKHPIVWETEEGLTFCPVMADRDLMKRAVSNLIQNAINHNEQGCSIYVGVSVGKGLCTIAVSDDGKGASPEELEQFNKTPHYMVCDENVQEQRHGLGLMIVKQILEAHQGTAVVEPGSHGGFGVKLALPIDASGGQATQRHTQRQFAVMLDKTRKN